MKDLITKIDFFSGLDDKILKKIADACIMRQFTRNETIVRQGEMGLGLYIIAKGHVKVDREQAGVRMQVAELGPEQFFGEMSLLDNKPRSATVTGIEETECLLLTRDGFVKLMNKYPEIPIRMARVLAERIRVANEKLAAAPPPPAVAPAAASAIAAPSAAPAAASTPSPNGTASAAAAAADSNGTKAQIHSRMLEAFDKLYTIKALSRFSVAVLGCPVEGVASNIVEHIRVGDVKALIFPAGEAVDMRIAAREPGDFTLHVFTPARPEPYKFGPVPVNPKDIVRLSMRSGAVRLKNGDRTIPFL
jgi:CRP/FNR family transcriptional regulator, cyclic AMP receptor protein